jgi:glutamate-1-semialdehyde 2,1-aminomutase
VCGYHGWQDWYIGSTARNKGVPEAVRKLTHPFKYNDLSSLQELFDRHPGQFAAVIMEPMSADEPAPGFLEGVKELTHKNGAVLIFDEIITGFRFALGGAQEFFGVTPDLAAIGKSMANGFPISAVVGKRELMKEMEEVFFSFTFGGETISLAAALATVRKMMREPVIETLWKEGKKVMDGVSERISRHGLERVFSIVGKPPWSLLMTADHPKATSWEIKSVFKQEMLLRGILISASHNMSYAHAPRDVDLLLAAYDEVFSLMRAALDQGTLSEELVGKPIEPIFKIR